MNSLDSRPENQLHSSAARQTEIEVTDSDLPDLVSQQEQLPDSAEFAEFKMHAQKKLAEQASQYVKTGTAKAAVAARVSALKGDTPIGPEPTSSMWQDTPAPRKGKRITRAAPNPFLNNPPTLHMTWSDPLSQLLKLLSSRCFPVIMGTTLLAPQLKVSIQ